MGGAANTNSRTPVIHYGFVFIFKKMSVCLLKGRSGWGGGNELCEVFVSSLLLLLLVLCV